jgi:hypothetical protein
MDRVGFEVRSLQEFMAGRALVNAADDAVLERLTLTARPAHWRNTWLLAVGRIFSKAEHLRPRVIALLREFDARDALSAVITPGPELAVDLLDDDVAARSPQYRRQLTQHALEILPLPFSSPEILARVLYDLGTDATLRPLITAALDQALVGDPATRLGARSIALSLQRETGELAAHARHLINASRLPQQQKLGRYSRLSSAVAAPLSEAGLTGHSREAVDLFLAEIHRFRRDFTNGPVDLPSPGPGALAVVQDEAASEAMAIVILDLPPENWLMAHSLRRILWDAAKRQPIGDKLLTLIAQELKRSC